MKKVLKVAITILIISLLSLSLIFIVLPLIEESRVDQYNKIILSSISCVLECPVTNETFIGPSQEEIIKEIFVKECSSKCSLDQQKFAAKNTDKIYEIQNASILGDTNTCFDPEATKLAGPISCYEGMLEKYSYIDY